MKSRIARIGNSKGVRLPKALLAAAGLSGEVEIEIHALGGTIIISRRKPPRPGWKDAALLAHERCDDRIDAF